MNEATQNTTAVAVEETNSRYHAAINFVPEDGKVVLARIKELGNTGLTVKLDRSIFGEIPPAKHEAFLIDAPTLLQVGNYLVAPNAKVVSRELGEAKVFDVKAAIEAAKNDAIEHDWDEVPF